MISERDELRFHSGKHSWLENRRGFSMGYDGTLKGARWVLEKVDASVTKPAVGRDDEFREDMLIPPEFRSTLEDYSGSGFDRGHLCPSADRREGEVWQSETFLLSNMSPQRPGFNRGPWKMLEEKIRKLASQDKIRGVWSMSLPLFVPGQAIEVIGRSMVPVPHAYAKVVLAERAGGRLRLWCISMDNKKATEPKVQPLSLMERWAGFPLFDRLHAADKSLIYQHDLWF